MQYYSIPTCMHASNVFESENFCGVVKYQGFPCPSSAPPHAFSLAENYLRFSLLVICPHSAAFLTFDV